MPQLDFYAEIDEHGIRWGDTGQILPDRGVKWHLG